MYTFVDICKFCLFSAWDVANQNTIIAFENVDLTRTFILNKSNVKYKNFENNFFKNINFYIIYLTKIGGDYA